MSNKHSIDTLYQKKLTQKRNKTTDLLHKNTILNTNERKNWRVVNHGNSRGYHQSNALYITNGLPLYIIIAKANTAFG